jgi:LuxR family maltose regulon positive regulatory protein
VNREWVHLSLARIRLAGDRTPEQRERTALLLEELAGAARDGKRFGPLIVILLLLSKSEFARSRGETALKALDEAVRFAQPEGYLRTFVEEGLPIADLLGKGLESGTWDEPALHAYAKGLLAAFRGEK